MFAFIKGFRYFPGENCVDRAHHDQNDGVEEGDHVRSVDVGVADKHVVFSGGVVEHGARWCHYHPYYHDQHLWVQ